MKGDWRQETGDRRQETGDRRQEGKRIKEKDLEIEDGEVDGQWKIGTLPLQSLKTYKDTLWVPSRTNGKKIPYK